MALFSRRPKSAASSETPAEPARADDEQDAASAAEADAVAVPHVPISVTAFGSGGRTPAAAPGEDAPAPAAPVVPEADRAPARPPHLANPEAEASTQLETVPGLRDNVLLRDALAALPAQASPAELMNVARQLLQGHLFIRVQGDARELLAKGEGLPMSIITYQEQKYLLAYSSGKALQEAVSGDGDTGTSALAQPVTGIIRQVVEGDFGGIAVDHASRPGSAILPSQLLEKALSDLDPEVTVKTLLAAPRTDAIPGQIAEALTTAPLWIAARRTESGQVGIAELRTPDGGRLLELFSHPLELVALGRGDQPAKVSAEQLGAALRSDEGIAGVIINPAGPWIRLGRDQLAPLLAVGA
ncbi:SseB family protein [Microbacterium sp. NPDC089189]|uniref:SseB family protein n=1 Tax=Microbacterium sp. NPDC089189 TaxID=3154972 RepID=UPI0034441E2E